MTASYPTPPATVRFDVINQGFALFQQQMGQWVVIALVYVIVVGVLAFVLNLIPFVGGMVTGVPAMILTGGLYRAALKHVRGETVSVADLFDIGDIIGSLVVAGILVGIGSGIAALFCVLPTFVVNGLWMFTVPLIADKGMEGVSAMRESWHALQGQWLMAAVYVFVIGLVTAVGALVCGVGILFTLPIAVLANTLLYRDFFPETALPSEPAAPPAY